MKPTPLSLLAALSLAGVLVAVFPPHAAGAAQSSGQPAASGSEYATIRWAGRDDTHIIRPGGKVEFIGQELRKIPRPDRCDPRSFYMNIALNGLVKEGWEFVGMTPDDIVVRRPLAP